MLNIELKFPSGSFHATPWGRNVNEGVPEWPPSPYRLVRALYDAWKRKRPEWQVDRIEPLLAALASDPPLFSLPPASATHTRSFLSENNRDVSKRQLVFDAFVVLDKESSIIISWPNVELDEAQKKDLDELLSLLNYLGRSESWVAARVMSQSIDVSWNCTPLVGQIAENGKETVQVACPVPSHVYASKSYAITKSKKGKPDYVGWLDALAWSVSDVLDSKISEPPAFQFVMYTRPARCFDVKQAHEAVKYEPQVNGVLFGLESKVLPQVTSTIEVSERIRRKLMGVHKRITGDPKKVSLRFSGKDTDGKPLKGHRHAYIMPLDTNKDGLLDHLLITCKEPFELEELLALDRLRSIWQTGGRPDIQLVALQWGKMGEIIGTKPNTRFISATPFLPPRHYRRARGDFEEWLEQEVVKEAENHGLPRPVQINIVPRLISTSRDIRWLEFRRNRKDENAQIGYGFELTFPEPVTGPLAIGRDAHFGLGLFVPQ
jgi:CRISPR-associated protein Csb2